MLRRSEKLELRACVRECARRFGVFLPSLLECALGPAQSILRATKFALQLPIAMTPLGLGLTLAIAGRWPSLTVPPASWCESLECTETTRLDLLDKDATRQRLTSLVVSDGISEQVSEAPAHRLARLPPSLS
jgi:hypothetical protein